MVYNDIRLDDRGRMESAASLHASIFKATTPNAALDDSTVAF